MEKGGNLVRDATRENIEYLILAWCMFDVKTKEEGRPGLTKEKELII